MARTSASETESRTSTHQTVSTAAAHAATTTAAKPAKQKLTAAQQQYLRDLVKRHITNNHPQLQPVPDPLDFANSYSDDFLRCYKDRYNLPVNDNMTLQGYLLGSSLGSKTVSHAKIAKFGRVTKSHLADHVKRHFLAHTVKENVCIPQFIYKVKTQRKKFKMEFND